MLFVEFRWYAIAVFIKSASRSRVYICRLYLGIRRLYLGIRRLYLSIRRLYLHISRLYLRRYSV